MLSRLSIGAMGGGGGEGGAKGRWGKLAQGIAGGGEQQRYTQADFDDYSPGGDYGAAPTYDWEAGEAQGGKWAGFLGGVDRAQAGLRPGGMENYNRRMYLQQQKDLNDPQMSSIWQGRDDWQKDPAMVDEMWGDVNKFYGNPMAGGDPGMEGAMGKVSGAIGAAKGVLQKGGGGLKGFKGGGMARNQAIGHDGLDHGPRGKRKAGGGGMRKPGMPGRPGMSAAMQHGAQNIGQMAKASRTSSYGG
jgi:hypothetical protein